jgi:hypothetical protein
MCISWSTNCYHYILKHRLRQSLDVNLAGSHISTQVLQRHRAPGIMSPLVNPTQVVNTHSRSRYIPSMGFVCLEPSRDEKCKAETSFQHESAKTASESNHIARSRRHAVLQLLYEQGSNHSDYVHVNERQSEANTTLVKPPQRTASQCHKSMRHHVGTVPV